MQGTLMLRRFAFLALIVAAAALASECETRTRLENADHVLGLAAGEHGPRLVELVSRDHHTMINEAPEALIDAVQADGVFLPVHWRFNSELSRLEPQDVMFVYENQSPRLRLEWRWQARSDHGPFEHLIRIENLDTREFWLPLQNSFQFKWRIQPSVSLEHWYVEKGAGRPSNIGTHRDKVPTGYKWLGTSSTYAHPRADQPREVIPWFLVQEENAAQDGWYVGVEFSARVQLAIERSTRSVRGTVGLNPVPGPFRTRLAPGESFETPTIFLGTSLGGWESSGNTLRRWVREVLGNSAAWLDPQYPLLVNNSWGGGMNVDEDVAKKMIDDATALGFEMFHLDAGWFRGVGDWYPNPAKFPHGLAAIADYAHEHGLRFGLWVDWAQAGVDQQPGALNARDAKVNDWLVSDLPPGWKPQDFKGQTIDIGVPAAKQWAQQEVNRIVGDYHLDMLEHDGYLVAQGCARADHPHAPPSESSRRIYKDEDFFWVDSSNSTDVSYHATRAYYEIHSSLRKSHPGLLLEICNDGGRMVDFGSAAHGDYFSITDSYDPLSNRRAFYDTSQVLPPPMLETYVEKWPTPKLENFVYMLRSGMMGWMSIMINTTQWTPEQRLRAREELALYKRELRPLIREANLYHVSQRPDGVHWDGTEYYDPNSARGALFAFRGSARNEATHTFALRGLEAGSRYRLHFQDHTAADASAGGWQLMHKGLTVSLPTPNSSEIVLLQQVP